jgi:hypothetical protein
MPDFSIVPMREAQASTSAGRQGRFIQEYIRQIPQGQAGKLHLGEHENPLTIRRRLDSAVQAVDIKLIIKRSGQDMFFWKETGADEQPRPKPGRRSRHQEETAIPETPEQYFKEEGELEHGVPKEDSPELGQT